MIHNTFHHSLFDQDFLFDQKMFGCFVHGSDKNQSCWWSWSEYPPVSLCMPSRCWLLLSSSSHIIKFYKVRDDGDGGSFYFILKYF